MLRTILTIVAVLVIVGIGYILFFGDNGAETLSPQEVTVQGTYICLPHRDMSGPQTLECAFGLQVDNTANYALDMSALEPGWAPNFSTGDVVEVTGTLIARNQLDADDQLLQYDIDGVLQVASITSRNEGTAARHVMPGGMVAFEVPDEFGLAVNQDQILVESAVPPCTEGFDYCIYYTDPQFENTNFESAGLRIEARTDLATQDACLTTQPEGYSSLTPETNEASTYATSVFAPIQSAATGQSSEGAVYRLYTDTSCYEFETRIGVSQFANFEPGTVEEFTAADRDVIESEFNDLLRTVRLTENESEVIFDI